MPELNQMPTPLFKAFDENSSHQVVFEFDRRRIAAPVGTSIAAALLLNGCGPFRSTPVNAKPRSAFCMMGVCFDCLVEVNGVPNRQACQISIQDGMVVKKQNGAALLQTTTESSENE